MAAVLALLLVGVTAGCSTKQLATPNTIRGGTLHLFTDQDVTAWDPQRIGSGPEGSFAIRTFLRTLTTHAPAGVGFLPGLVGDLASSTGDVTDGGRTWSFPMVSDATWQDGRFVTCADVKYGVSRSFAAGITGGTRYAVQLLDIPSRTTADGTRVSAYEGPWSGVGQSLFDAAVTCTGQSITFHLNTPRYDFDEIVSLPEFGPVRKDVDTNPQQQPDRFSVFSSGPYMLEGVWHPGEGGRFVRNRKWVGRDDPVRLAFPDVIEVTERTPADPATSVVQQLLDDSGDARTGVTWVEVPPATYPQLADPAVAPRTTRADSGDVDVLVPNPSSPTGADATVRRALAVATERSAYATADGASMDAVTSALPRHIPGRAEDGAADVPRSGDPAQARALLASRGVTLPISLRVAYPSGLPSSDATERALRALGTGWEQAGFVVTLVPVPAGTTPAADAYDLEWSDVSAAWPSGAAVLPDLLARQVVPGQAVAPALATLIEQAQTAATTATSDERNAAWSRLDLAMVTAGDVIPLAARQRVLLHGSGVSAYQDNILLGGRVDLAAIEVEHDPS